MQATELPGGGIIIIPWPWPEPELGPGRIEFVRPTATFIEGRPAEVAIRRVDGASEAVTVQVEVRSGTATLGADFTVLSTQSITFTPGQTRAYLSFSIRNDLAAEDGETIRLALVDPTHGATLGLNPEFVGTIYDSDKPFVVPAGNFLGLLHGHFPVLSPALIRLSVSAHGQVSGKLIFPTGSRAFRGRINAAGKFVMPQAVGRTWEGRFVRSLEIIFERPGNRFYVSQAGNLDQQGEGERLARTAPVTLARRYTAAIGPSLGPDGRPLQGFANLNFSSKGAASVICQLPDGHRATVYSGLTVSGRVPIAYAEDYSPSLSGWLKLDSDSRLTGPLVWRTPATSSLGVLVPEADIFLAFDGRPYSPPRARQSAIPGLAAEANAHVILRTAKLEEPLVRNISIDTRRRVTVERLDDLQLALELDAQTGAIRGEFLDPDGETRAIRGVIIQQLGELPSYGAGNFPIGFRAGTFDLKLGEAP